MSHIPIHRSRVKLSCSLTEQNVGVLIAFFVSIKKVVIADSSPAGQIWIFQTPSDRLLKEERSFRLIL